MQLSYLNSIWFFQVLLWSFAGSNQKSTYFRAKFYPLLRQDASYYSNINIKYWVMKFSIEHDPWPCVMHEYYFQ